MIRRIIIVCFQVAEANDSGTDSDGEESIPELEVKE